MNTSPDKPATTEYVRTIAIPFGAEHGIDVQELHRRKRDGSTAPTLYQRLTAEGSRSLPIPVRMSDTGAPGTRNCTGDFKIKVIGRWLREHGATKDDPAHVGIGISTDEIQRAHPGVDPKSPIQVRTYPLLDLGLSRGDCEQVILGAGIPVPQKSACYFCPFHKPSEWRRMKRDEPDLFAKSVALEALLNERRAMLEKDPVWFTRFLKPLDEAISPDGDQLAMDLGTGDCESGYCMT